MPGLNESLGRVLDIEGVRAAALRQRGDHRDRHACAPGPEVKTRGSGGCAAVYPVGAVALLAVVGDEGLDTVRLYRESRATVENLERLQAGGADRGKPQAAAS